ncbi:MAG: hypothetical protein H0X33_10555 [Taibaiella sp.]|nr:hypothetical protein [Taibaiella sp.]
MLRSTGGLIICLLLSLNTTAQPLAAYVDLQNEVMVWDRGIIRKVDYLPPNSMKIGRIAIPYIDNSNSFKIFYGGGVKTLNAGFTNLYYASDDLIMFLNAKSLNVFDRGTIKNLTGICNQYALGDSVLMYLDGIHNDYRVYYNGTSTVIESFIPDSILSAVKVSDNIVAYKNFANQFRIFYHGRIIAQEDFAISSFDVGRNTVAYVDANRQFKIFHNGQTFVVDDYPPQTFTAGDNLVAYVSNDGYFKIFYEDSVRVLGFFNPTYLSVSDNIVGYRDPSGYFKVFYKGDITDMETYLPTGIVMQYNSVAYINSANTLRLFTEGEVYDVTNADLQNWELHYDVIKYQIGQNIYKIFYKGTEY